MIKIAVCGKMGSGKNEFLKVAQREYPQLQIIERKFAESIYGASYEIQKYLGLEQSKDGKLLQFLGQHYKDLYGDDYWCKIAAKSIVTHNHIFTDLRFPTELEYCKDLGYTIVKVVRRDELRLESMGNRDPNHISETALDKKSNSNFDYIINNNGTLELFEGAVCSIMNNILRKIT